MSKICENCGNMIPDGADICPGCGRQQYSEDALESILSELSFALDEIQSDEPQQEQDQVFSLPQMEIPEETFEKTEEVAEEAEEEPKMPTDPVIAAIGDQSRKNMGKQPAAPKEKKGTSPKKAPANKKGKKNSKAMGSGSTALAIIVGILIALLLVAGAAFLMLYRMGFFDLMNGEQLLNTTTAETQTTSTLEPQLPSVQEEAHVEAPAEEPEEASVVEEPVEDDTTIPELSIDEPEKPPVDVDKFNLTGADDMTFVSRGETAQIVYVIAPESAEPEIEWESSDETVATVSASGVITARRGGNCTITGTCGDKEVSVKVICAFSVPTTVLDMNYSDITMDHEGQEVQLAIDYELTDEQVKATSWESSDPDVASVNEVGLVTALKNGTVVISASIGDYTASCIVRCVNVEGNRGVNPDDSEYVINYEDVTLSRKGEYFQLSLKSILDNELPEFTWESSDSDVATVDSKGVVTAVADGTCKITTTIGKDDFECIVRVHISG